MVDRFLKNKPLIKHPLTASQYDYREDRSTETALYHLMSTVEVHLQAKNMQLVVFRQQGGFR